METLLNIWWLLCGILLFLFVYAVHFPKKPNKHSKNMEASYAWKKGWFNYRIERNYKNGDRELVAKVSVFTNEALIKVFRITEALIDRNKNAKTKAYLERRISELYKADNEFCKDRWDMTKPAFERSEYRNQSNAVTLARQELQAALKAHKQPEENNHNSQ